MDAFSTNIKPTELRRSCVFCRQRKMRCSGDLPCCTTCRQREKPCVYEPVAFKGRYAAVAAAKNARSMSVMTSSNSNVNANMSATTAAVPNSTMMTSATIGNSAGIIQSSNEVDPIYISTDEQMKPFQDYVSFSTSSSSVKSDQNNNYSKLSSIHAKHLSSPTNPIPSSNAIEGSLIGDELTFLFGTFYTMTHQSALIHNANQKNDFGSNTTASSNSAAAMGAQSISIPLTYVDALPSLTYDLVRLTMNRINNINVVKKNGDFTDLPYVHSLIMDRSMTVIDGLDNPEAEQWFAINGPPSSNQIEQLLEMAFNNHPLASLVVPKTPFIRDQQEGHSNYCLLWLLCSEGIELGLPTIGVKPNTPLAFNLPSSAAFLQLAWKQLFNARQNVPSDRFWISQALLLLGFRLLCHSHVKQATSFLLLCVRCISRVVSDRSRNPALEVKINGIRMTEVEEQAVNNVFWISHGLLLWIWSQVDRSDGELARFICPDPPVLLTAITAAKIPSTSLCSDAIYKLDYVSAQFTSLNMQSANARTLTVLAHVCNMVHNVINLIGSSSIGVSGGGAGGIGESSSFFSFPQTSQTFSSFGGDQNEDINQTVMNEQNNPTSSIDDFSTARGSTMYASVSARLLHQTKQTLSAVSNSHLADKYVEKTILSIVYLFSICLCEPSSTNSNTQKKELAHRFRSAIDIAGGMVRDCKDDQPIFHQLAPPKERVMIKRFFGHASKVLFRIYAILKQVEELANPEIQHADHYHHHNTQVENMFETGLSSQEISITMNAVNTCAEEEENDLDGPLFDVYFRTESNVTATTKFNPLEDIAAIARSLISPKPNMDTLSNSQKGSSDSAVIGGSDHLNRFNGIEMQRKGSVAGTTVSNEEYRSIDATHYQMQHETQRARSFSDSAAIYSSTSQTPQFPPHNMSFIQQSPTYSSFFHTMPPPSTSGYTSFTSAMHAAATATANVTGSAGAGEVSASTSSSSSSHHQNNLNGITDHLGNIVPSIALRRSRTYSINEVRSELSFPSSLPSSLNGGSQFPPSPPQSAPPSHLALLSDTSATLQAMLHDYNVSTNNGNNNNTTNNNSDAHNSHTHTEYQEHPYQHSNSNQAVHQHTDSYQRSYHHDLGNSMMESHDTMNDSCNGNNENINSLRTANWAATSGGTTTIQSMAPLLSPYNQDIKVQLH